MKMKATTSDKAVDSSSDEEKSIKKEYKDVEAGGVSTNVRSVSDTPS